MIHAISNNHLSIERVAEIIAENTTLELSAEAREKIQSCRDFLDDKIERSEKPIYGINTGFGSLCGKSIDRNSLEQLQKNLVMSHACGTGSLVPQELVKLMLLLKVQGLSYGHSGVTLATVERLIWHFNNDVLPVIYEQGSLGASGDLAPLAHLALPLIGLGAVYVDGKISSSSSILEKHGLKPIALRSKEGLALLNGTQFMSAYGVHSLIRAGHLLDAADLIASVSLEGYDGRCEPYNHQVHAIRRHSGQIKVAENIRKVLADSKTWFADKVHVQDPYSFRCVPQVHGASRDAIAHIKSVFENEINAVTDNPTVFPDSDDIISAGNFHGQPLAISLDFLAIAMAEIGSISERRTYKLIGGERGLPPFLVANPGLNSGFMIPQYTAASIVSKNKQLCTPSSVDTIDSSNGQEDHVSMGANGAVKAAEVINNIETVLGIELLNAMQAIELRGMEGMATAVKAIHADYRKRVDFLIEDCELYPFILKSKEFVSKLNTAKWLSA
ncbi:histidine ammonia-lyase [Cryomorpha ignava]|uniref:Histidine ammonia-lyase n=1 Tax=Cryomorpha ignava TaxID=101383 RepID=A0A7K3WU61_9FLAO|nr:histidine ammonia-lyase [Cryomorpha ignava]NEN25210.1 histidine ammonia-lyase [Cryomorpha ignava]